MDPEIIWEHRLAALEGKFVGPEAVTGWYADLWEHFEAVEIDCPDVRDLVAAECWDWASSAPPGRRAESRPS